MEESKKKLGNYSKFFIFLAILDVIEIVCDYMISNQSTDKTAAQGAFIAVCIYLVITAIIKFTLGSKGLKQANGTYTGTVHITLATILLVLSVCMVAYQIYSIFQGNANYFNLVIQIVAVLVLNGYRDAAKQVK